MRISKRLLLGLGLATLLVESLAFHPALAADKVSLFRVITTRDEIVIGIPEGELAKATPNKGGHRERALGLIDQAIGEVRAGIAFAAGG